MYLERVREELSRVNAAQEAVITIINNYSSGGGGGGGAPDPKTLPCGSTVSPTAPTGVQVTGGFGFFLVEWDMPEYCGHSHTEVYGIKDSNVLNNPVLLGTSQGVMFSMAVKEMDTRYCFWAKHVNLLGEKSAYNATEGQCAVTALDPGYLINLLTGKITTTQLYEDLGKKIELLPQFGAAISELTGVVGELSEGVTNIVVESPNQCLIDDVDNPTYATDEATCQAHGGLWVAGGITTLQGLKKSTDTSMAAIAEVNNVSATSTSANASRLAGLVAQVDIPTTNPPTTLSAYVVDSQKALVETDRLLAERVSGVEVKVGGDPRPNLCPNSGFEQGLEGMFGTLTGFTVTPGAAAGRNLSSNSPVQSGLIVWPPFSVVPGATYSITGDARATLASGTTGTTQYVLFFYLTTDDGATPYWSVAAQKTGAYNFDDAAARRVEFTASSAAPDWAVCARVGFQWYGGNFSNISVRRAQAVLGAPPMPPYSAEGSLNQTAARVIDVETAKIGYCSVIATGETTEHGTKALCEASSLRKWNVGLPWSTAVKQVSVTAANHQTATVQQQFEAIYGDSGLRAQYSVKIDNSGVVSGFGLSSEPANNDNGIGGSRSLFLVRADHFGITGPTYNQASAPTTNLYNGMAWRNTNTGVTLYCLLGTPPTVYWISATEFVAQNKLGPGLVPFQVLTSPTPDADGGTIPAGVYIWDAYIKNATITTAKIKNAAITDAKILNLSANKILAGSIGVDQYIQSNDYAAGTAGWKIASATTNPAVAAFAEFNNVTYRGKLYGGAATGFDQGAPGMFSGVATDGVYKFRVGNVSASTNPSRIAWDGTNLGVVGLINAKGGRISGLLTLDDGVTATSDVLELDGPNQRLRLARAPSVNNPSGTRVVLGRASDGSMGLFIRDENGKVAVSSYGTEGLTGETDAWGEAFPGTKEFYIGSAYIKKLRTGNLNPNAATNMNYGTDLTSRSAAVGATAAGGASTSLAMDSSGNSGVLITGSAEIGPSGSYGVAGQVVIQKNNSAVRACNYWLSGATEITVIWFDASPGTSNNYGIKVNCTAARNSAGAPVAGSATIFTTTVVATGCKR